MSQHNTKFILNYFSILFFTLFLFLSIISCSSPTNNGEDSNALKAPAGLTVTETETKNTVKLTWTDNNSPYYWIYYNTTNNTETATCKTKSASSSNATYGYEITLSSSGTYYFWIKSADGYTTTSNTSDFSTPVTYNFTYEALIVPSGLTITATETKNTIKIIWNDNGSAYYWIYYNSTNDTTTATCKTKSATSSNATYGYEITLPSSGTYYFWIKSADGYTTSSNTSDFSTSVSYDFTYTALTAPTGLQVTTTETQKTIKITWEDNKSAYYWIYYNSTNDTTTATCKTKSATSSNATYGYEITLPSSGTYYFWIKSADGYTTSSNTSDFSESVIFTLQ